MARGRRKVKSGNTKEPEKDKSGADGAEDNTQKEAEGNLASAGEGFHAAENSSNNDEANGEGRDEQGHAHVGFASDLCDETGENECVWAGGKEDKLIDLFRDCTFLYDKQAPAFQERHKKDKAIARFAEILGVTTKQVSTRLRTLRTAYSRVSRYEPSGSGVKKLSARSQHLAKRLSFLQAHTVTRTTTTILNLRGIDEESDTSTDSDENVEDVDMHEAGDMMGGACGPTASTSGVTPGQDPNKQKTKSAAEKPAAVGAAGGTKKGGVKKGRKQDNTDVQEKERTDVMKEVAATIKGALENKNNTPAPPPRPHDAWLTVIGERMQRMTLETQDEFKHHVEDVSFHATRGTWHAPGYNYAGNNQLFPGLQLPPPLPPLNPYQPPPAGAGAAAAIGPMDNGYNGNPEAGAAALHNLNRAPDGGYYRQLDMHEL